VNIKSFIPPLLVSIVAVVMPPISVRLKLV